MYIRKPENERVIKGNTAWKVSKCVVFSSPNTGKYGPEKIPCLDTFHGVKNSEKTSTKLKPSFLEGTRKWLVQILSCQTSVIEAVNSEPE